jgi:hypothetical protein
VSPWPRAELRAGLAPGRLVLRDEIVAAEPVAELKRRAAGRRVSVVLSNHFVRYAVLRPSKALRSRADWSAYARHAFEAVYGAPARGWEIRIHGLVAAAADRALLDELRTIPGLDSVQPYLMAAFNARRRHLKEKSAWFVVQEPGRIAIGLFADGGWKLMRTRRVGAEWTRALEELLDREALAAQAPDCTRAVVCAEDELPQRAGRYEIVDAALGPRAQAMVLR